VEGGRQRAEVLLVRAVRKTMQPEHVWLWLRPDTSSKGEQTD
jgi:hypothetical protein